MNILSFDVGIKNLAYCLVNISDDKQFNIIDWGVINLMTNESTIISQHSCTTCKKKATLQTVCGDRFYCTIHAKKDPNFKPIDNKFKEFAIMYSINKIPMKRLNEFIANNSIILPNKKKLLKSELLEIVKKHIEDRCFVKCGSGEKKKKASGFDLVSLGIALRNKFDQTFSDYINKKIINKIVIENQIGPLAIRMKSLQGMITQYFIMHGLEDISNISASNKLKVFEGTEYLYEKDSDDEEKTDNKYKERKNKSVEIVSKMLETTNELWAETFQTHTKKDDLADSLLQALWYASTKFN